MFNSRFSARRVREAGIRLERCEVVHPAPDPRFGAAIAGERPWRWRLLYVGRVERRKGVDVAIRALARLPEEDELLISGSAACEDG